MSDAYISPNHTTIGEYRISETLFDSTRLDSVLDNLILSASDLYLSAADVSGKVDRITTELESIASQLKSANEDIDYLSGVVSALKLVPLKHTIADVGILRPEEAHELLLKVTVFDSKEMSAEVGTIDMGNSSSWKYFKALIVNNGVNSEEASEDPTSPKYFPGTQWVTPAMLDEAIKQYGTPAGFKGYNSAFNNSPVNISFLEWLKDEGLEDTLNANSRFYLRYEWYYEEDGEIHNSDHFSMIVPSFSEVGAKARSQVSKAEIYELKQALETDVATAHFIEDDELDDPMTRMMTYPSTGFYVNPFQCTILEAFASKTKKIILQDYTEGKAYKLKFTTGSSNLSIGGRVGASVITFYGNQGNGPEKIDELNSSTQIFEANTTYLIQIQLGMVQIIASQAL